VGAGVAAWQELPLARPRCDAHSELCHAVDHEIRYLTTSLVLIDVTAPNNHPALASKSRWLPHDLDLSYDEGASCSNDDSGGAADNASARILPALTARAIRSGFVTLSDGPREMMRSMPA
jgi:hypothetical protein